MKKARAMPPNLMAAVRGEADPGEWGDVVALLRSAYEDGIAGRDSQLPDFDERSAAWCKANGGVIRALNDKEECALRTLMAWEYKAWSFGREDAGKAVRT